MTKSRTLPLLALVIALTLSVAACGSSKTTTTTTSGAASSTRSSGGSGSAGNSGSGAYPTAFVSAFISGCDKNGGTKAYCECVIAYIKSNVAYDTVLSSQKSIADGKKPSWYTQAIRGCLSKL